MNAKPGRPLDEVLLALFNIIPADSNPELSYRLILLSKKYLFLPPEANSSSSWEKAADILQGFLDDSSWAETARKVFKGELDYKDYLK